MTLNAQPLIGGVSVACGTCDDTDTHMAAVAAGLAADTDGAFSATDPPRDLQAGRRSSPYPSVSVFRRKSHIFADNSVGWHLATNSFHQHVRLLMEISPHTFFSKKYFDPMEECVFQKRVYFLCPKKYSDGNHTFLPITPSDGT